MSDEENNDDNVISMNDEAKLKAAEEALEDIKDWLPVASLSSASGITDTDVLERITFLGSKGISATYRTTGVGIEGGGLFHYVILVAPEQKAEAIELLNSRK